MFGGSEASQKYQSNPIGQIGGSGAYSSAALGSKNKISGDLVISDNGAMQAALDLARESFKAIQATSGGSGGAIINQLALYGTIAGVAILALKIIFGR